MMWWLISCNLQTARGDIKCKGIPQSLVQTSLSLQTPHYIAFREWIDLSQTLYKVMCNGKLVLTCHRCLLITYFSKMMVSKYYRSLKLWLMFVSQLLCISFMWCWRDFGIVSIFCKNTNPARTVFSHVWYRKWFLLEGKYSGTRCSEHSLKVIQKQNTLSQ